MPFKRRSLTRYAIAMAVAALAGCTTPPPKPVPEQPVPVAPPVPTPVPAPVPVPEPVVAPPPAPTPLLTAATYADLPGWLEDDVREAWPAFMQSCSVIGRRPNWAAPCAAARLVDATDAAAVRAFFEAKLVPHRLRQPDGTDTGLITGYYEAQLRGSRKRSGPYQFPLYRVPDDLLTIELGSVYPQLNGMRLRGRLVGKKVLPYYSRAEIANGAFRGKELLWVDDPVEAFFLEVQGSGRVALDSGETVRVNYADQNGHPYKAIGRWLIENGELTVEQASAQGIKAWIAANPQRRQELFNANASAVFFREEALPDPSQGPRGALNVPLTPGRSLAIDPRFVPLGTPVYLATTRADSDIPLQRLMMGQDTGGAIRGEVRADFFYGIGRDAEEQSGRMKQRGAMWLLLPKTQP
jgi:membrane-bound lytic murein transglycosylase A